MGGGLVNLTLQDLQREAAAAGFLPGIFEKAIRLLSFLDALRSHPFLKTRVALKGGTALNLFIFDVPRLSVDIDLNYVGAADRETTLAERPKIDRAVEAVCGREALVVKRAPAENEHAGGKWRLAYAGASGQNGNIEIDMNFMLRTPLWPVRAADSRRLGSFGAAQVPLLDLHELAAGKLAALVARSASRDVFDACELLRRDDLDRAKLRVGFVVYGGANRKDWRTVSIDDVKIDPGELTGQLVPMLRTGTSATGEEVAPNVEGLAAECRERLSAVLPLRPAEREFLERLNDQGEIAPELLTADAGLASKIRQHPALRWKAMNVRKHRGLPPGEALAPG